MGSDALRSKRGSSDVLPFDDEGAGRLTLEGLRRLLGRHLGLQQDGRGTPSQAGRSAGQVTPTQPDGESSKNQALHDRSDVPGTQDLCRGYWNGSSSGESSTAVPNGKRL